MGAIRANSTSFKKGTLPPNYQDLSGNKYNFLTVLGRAEKRSKYGRILWDCKCDCGGTKCLDTHSLKGNIVKSCGCLGKINSKNAVMKANTVHGGYSKNKKKMPEFIAWRNMSDRCYNVNGKCYKNYGARGIGVCDRWRFGENGKHGFICFMEDMGFKPDKTYSLDRMDVNGNYEPNNCRWASVKEQNNNRRTALGVVHNNTNMSFYDAIQQTSPTLVKLQKELGRGLTGQEIFDALKVL